MRKVLVIAAREFIATVATRGFIIGWLFTPVLITLLMLAIPRLFNQSGFRAEGQIAVIDSSGVVAHALADVVDPRTLAQRRLASARAIVESTFAAGPAPRVATAGADAMAAAAAREVQIPDLHVLVRPPDADMAHERAWLAQPAPPKTRHLALVVVHPEAISGTESGDQNAYDLYVPASLDSRIEGVIREVLHDAIVSVRARAYRLDLTRLDQLTSVRGKIINVSRLGAEQPAAGLLNRIMPFALIAFMLIGALGGGQFLLTTMVEEKSSRIIEVLLSAVSPVELLAGKILGQLGASLLGMGLYLLVAIVALLAFALFGLIDTSLLFYLLLFFLISFLVIGSVMVGVGAAVNEMRDAQSLLAPFMIALSAMWILVMPLSLNPGSRLATALSFTPVLSSFAMMVRLASASPPPLWQVCISVLVGLASVALAIAFAARIFRIALLLHGRPPSLGTLIRWAMSP